MFSSKLRRFSPRRVMRSVRKTASSVARGTKRGVARQARSFFERQPVARAASRVTSRVRTAARQVRQSVRANTRQQARGIVRTARRTMNSARGVVRTAAHARAAASTRVRRAVPAVSRRLSGAASRAVSRSGLGRGASALRRTASRVVRNPTAQRLGRTLGAGQRALGHARSLQQFGGSVRKLGTDGMTAARDIRRAVSTRNLSDVRKALGSSRNVVNSAHDVVSQAAGARDAVRAGLNTIRRVAPRTSARLSGAASRVLNRSGLGRGASALRRTASRVVRNPTAQRLGRTLRTSGRLLGHARTLHGFGSNVARLPGKATTAVRDVRTALRTRGVEDVDKAIGSSRDFVNSARDVVTGAAGARRSARVLGRSFRRAAPRVSARLSGAASRIVRSRGTRTLTRMAQRVGSRTAVRAGARVGGRALARFAPGANIAMAGLDTAAFANTLRDKNASTGKKVLAGIRAAGSIAAATNIPVVSQAGAALSTVADIASSVKLPKVKLPKFW